VPVACLIHRKTIGIRIPDHAVELVLLRNWQPLIESTLQLPATWCR